jgi:hypothetical protein
VRAAKIMKGSAVLPIVGALVVAVAGCGTGHPAAKSPPSAVATSQPATSQPATPTTSPTPEQAPATANERLIADGVAASIPVVPTRAVAGPLMLAYVRFEHAYGAAWGAVGQPSTAESVARIAGGFRLCWPSTGNSRSGCDRFTKFTVNQASQVTSVSVNGEPVAGRLTTAPAAMSDGLTISGVVAYRLTGAQAVAVAFKLTDNGYRPSATSPALLASLNGASQDVSQNALPNFLAPGDVLYAAAVFDVTQVSGTFCLQPNGAGGQLPCTRLSKI